MSYNLFLDDVRMPKQVRWVKLPDVQWTIVRSYDEFVATIKERGLPQIITFDHDLAEEHYTHVGNPSQPYDTFKTKTGYDAAKWLVEYCENNDCDIPEYYVHSLNYHGVQNIIRYLEGYKSFNAKGR